jgi:hypothetical protein
VILTEENDQLARKLLKEWYEKRKKAFVGKIDIAIKMLEG